MQGYSVVFCRWGSIGVTSGRLTGSEKVGSEVWGISSPRSRYAGTAHEWEQVPELMTSWNA